MPTQPEPELLTDEELAGLMRISLDTLQRHLRRGPPTKKLGKRGQADLRTIRHFLVGGSRRWVRSSAIAFINGQTEERV